MFHLFLHIRSFFLLFNVECNVILSCGDNSVWIKWMMMMMVMMMMIISEPKICCQTSDCRWRRFYLARWTRAQRKPCSAALIRSTLICILTTRWWPLKHELKTWIYFQTLYVILKSLTGSCDQMYVNETLTCSWNDVCLWTEKTQHAKQQYPNCNRKKHSCILEIEVTSLTL